MSPINHAAVYNRAQALTLNSDQTVALATVAIQSLERDRQLLSSCQICGGPKRYNRERGRWLFEHEADCPVALIEAIEPLPDEAEE